MLNQSDNTIQTILNYEYVQSKISIKECASCIHSKCVNNTAVCTLLMPEEFNCLILQAKPNN